MNRQVEAFMLIALGLCPKGSAAVHAAAPPRPNIVLIMADDMGWGDVAFHKGPFRTPVLDRLAAGGMELQQHYVAPVCSPTRCSLMTGRYWSRFGVTAPQNSLALPFGTVTLASALKSVGYDTALVGKWHLGSKPEWGPNHFGFDHSYGSLAGGVSPYAHRYKKGPFSRTWHRNEQFVDEEGHVTDLLTEEAVRWIESRREHPFFLYVPFTAVHIPIQEPQRWLDSNPQITDSMERLYGACVTHLDHSVGRIIDALDRTGNRDNTLVVFISDNGATFQTRNAASPYPGNHPVGVISGLNKPLRGHKGQLHEGGIRVPAVANWPARLRPGKMNYPVHVADWMPTLCALAGYEPTEVLRWDGLDIGPWLNGERSTEPRTLYIEGPHGREKVLRQGSWKLLVRSQGKQVKELYDLSRDPFEQHDLAQQKPKRVVDLLDHLEREAARDNDAVAQP